jgi:hypothetical protein
VRRYREGATFGSLIFFGGKVIGLCDVSLPSILNHIDSVVSQSRGNKSIQHVYLYPYAFNVEDTEIWDKVGQAIGNLQALKSLRICTQNYHEDDDDDEEDNPLSPDREILARILSHIRQKVKVVLENNDDEYWWDAEESQSFHHYVFWG